MVLIILCSIKIERLLSLKFLRFLAFFDSYLWPFNKTHEKIIAIFMISAIIASIWNVFIKFHWHDEKLTKGMHLFWDPLWCVLYLWLWTESTRILLTVWRKGVPHSRKSLSFVSITNCIGSSMAWLHHCWINSSSVKSANY